MAEDQSQGISRDGIAGKALNFVEGAGSQVGAVLGDDHIVVRKTRKIWQYFLLYPAVFAAVLGSIPTVINIYKSVTYGVEASQVAHVEEQRELWIKNLHCVQNLNYHIVQTSDGATVQVGACPNGDVLIELIPQGSSQSVAEWVSMSRVKSAGAVGSLLFGSAYAGEVPGSIVVAQATSSQTICTNLDNASGMMVRVMKIGDSCYREEINTLKGQVSKKPVACNTPCK